MSKKINTFGAVLGDAYDLILKKPSLLFPLTIVAFLEGLWLELLYFTPQHPLSTVFLPPVKRFFGEMATHYPAYLFLIPKFFGRGQQLLIFLFFGGVLTAATTLLAASASENHPLTFSAAWKKIRGRVLTLILLSLFTLTLIGFIMGREFTFFKVGFDFAHKGPLFKILRFLLRSARYLNFLLAIAIQSFTVFLFPFAVLENRGFFRAIGNSFMLGWKQFKRIFVLLLVPTLCYSPLWFLKGNLSMLVQRTRCPEAILWVLGVGIVASLLVDTFIAVSATLFFLRVRHEKSA